MNLLILFWEFLKIGCFSFGGAYFSIPLIREAVLSNGWLSEEVFSYFVAVSESTPGPIMVNMATYVGSSQAGILGAFVATLGVVLPAFLIILLVAKVMDRFLQNKGVRSAMDGIRPMVVGVISATGAYMLFENLLNVAARSVDWRAVIIAAILTAILIVYKKIKKKAFSAILLIVISAVLGIIIYGI